MSHTNEQTSTLVIFISIGLLLTAGILYWYLLHPKNTPAAEESIVFCTMEARLCPDGETYVGRSGPNCEFDACPVVADATDTSASTTITVGTEMIVYPESLGLTYIRPESWPPELSVTSKPYVCEPSETVQERIIGERKFCITTISEGAAGSIFASVSYAYETATQETATISFTLRTVQCLNYDMPEQGDCLAEQDSLDVDALVASMVFGLER